jgi:recombination protein RecA
MSSLLVCAPSTTEFPLAFAGKKDPALIFEHKVSAHQVLERLSAMPKLAAVTPASRLEVRPTPEMVASGIRELDELSGGLPRGCLAQICGPASSGRTSILLAALAAATRRQEVCALVDVSNALDPLSAAAAGVDFEKLLWVRCGVSAVPIGTLRSLRAGSNGTRDSSTSAFPAIPSLCENTSSAPSGLDHFPLATHGLRRGLHSLAATRLKSRRVSDCEEKFRDTNSLAADKKKKSAEDRLQQALRATDLLLHSGGFGLVAIDLGDIPFKEARRIPLTSWFRFQRAVEHTPTVLLVVAQEPLAQTCAALLLKVGASGKKLPAFNSQSSGALPSHAQLLDGLWVEGELLRSRLQRKPAGSATAAFSTKTIRAG